MMVNGASRNPRCAAGVILPQKSLLPRRNENDRSRPQGRTGAAMPSLMKLLTVVGVIAALGYGAMFALATYVNPRSREIVVNVPPDRFVRQQH
jgi:predicted MFS family arabinose efflux permease